MKRKNKAWTVQELKRLDDLLQVYTPTEIAQMGFFPDRTESAICHGRDYVKGLHDWEKTPPRKRPKRPHHRQRAFFNVAAIAAVALCLCGCRTQNRVVTVTVPEVHEVHHWHTDSTNQSDSVIHEKETVVMQADSATMAHFGIQLKENERAWMIRTKELEKQLQRMERLIAERDTVHDSIPMPYPVEVEVKVPAQLTAWQRFRLSLGNVMLYALLIIGGLWLWKLWRK